MNRILSVLRLKGVLSLLVLSMLAQVFVIPREAEALTIDGVSVSEVADTSVRISWMTDVDAIGLVDYGTTPDMGQPMISDDVGKDHVIILSGLEPDTKYYFRIFVDDGQGQDAVVDGTPFTTLSVAGGDQTPNAFQSLPPPSMQAEAGPVYPTGTLAKEVGSSTIYFLMEKDRVKIPFTSGEVFSALGYEFGYVKTLDLSAYRLPHSYFLNDNNMAHPWGSWLLWTDGTVYYAAREGLVAVPSWDIFLQNGGSADRILIMNAADDATWDPDLAPLQANDPRLL